MTRASYEHAEGAEADRYENHLKSRRTALGLSQGELAERVGLTRQAIYMIEAGRYLPNATTALRLARALSCRVEDLFALEDATESVEVELVGEPLRSGVSERVKLWKVGDRRFALPMRGLVDAWGTVLSADGLARAERGSETGSPRAIVETLQSAAALDAQIAVAGCDPALSVIADRLLRTPGSIPVIVWSMGSTDAIERLALGQVHLAGVHLREPSGEFNLPSLRRHLGERALTVVTFAFWEMGLVVARGNPRNLRTAADLARDDVRVVNREPGSGARVLLDQRLAEDGVPSTKLRGYRTELHSHAAVARQVAEGLADAAIAPLAVGRFFDLAFVPWQTERYDLVIPRELAFGHAGIVRLLDALASRSIRRDIEALGGYDTTHTGEVVSGL